MKDAMMINHKKLRTILPFLFLFCLIASSCDPMRRINMHNRTSEDAEITWKIKEDSIHSSPFFISSDKEQKFKLAATKPGNAIFLSAGIGTWTPKELRNLVDDLESMVIRWDKGEIKLDTEEEIFQFLLSRRKGIGKDKIVIYIGEPEPG